jgi:hypothetical protein
MGFMFFKSILKPLINNCGMNGLNEKKGVKGERQHVKKRFSLTPSTISFLFVYDVLYPKIDLH